MRVSQRRANDGQSSQERITCTTYSILHVILLDDVGEAVDLGRGRRGAMPQSRRKVLAAKAQSLHSREMREKEAQVRNSGHRGTNEIRNIRTKLTVTISI